MQYKLFVLQLRATIQTVCIAGGSSYHTCGRQLGKGQASPQRYTFSQGNSAKKHDL